MTHGGVPEVCIPHRRGFEINKNTETLQHSVASDDESACGDRGGLYLAMVNLASTAVLKIQYTERKSVVWNTICIL